MRSKRLTGLFVTLLVLGCLVGVLVPAGLGWDFANFYDAGRRVAAGQADDLYRPADLIAGNPPQGKTGFYGTPISAVFYLPLAGLPPEAALVWFKLQNVAVFFASFALLFLFYRRFTPSGPAAQWEFAAVFTGLCLIFQPFWSVFRVGGQTTPTVLFLVTLALIFHTNARFWGSALCVVLAALIKPALAPAVLFLTCVSGRSFFWRSAAVLLAAGALSLLLLGWPVHADFVNLMLRSGQITYPWYFNSAIYILIDNIRAWIGPETPTRPYQPLFAGLTYGLQGVSLGTIAYLTRKAHRERWDAAALRHFDVMMAVLLFLFWSRTAWEHYLSLLFPSLVYVVAARARFSRPAIRLVAAIFVLSVFQNLIFTNWLRATFRLESLPALMTIAVYKSGPLALMLVFIWRHWRELFQSHAAWPATPRAAPAPASRTLP